MGQSRFFATISPHVLSITRIIVAGLFLVHGAQKLYNLPPDPEHFMKSLPPLILVAGILEFYGGILLLLGLFTRPVAFILSGQMAVAYFMAHAPKTLFPLWNHIPTVNHGELAVIYCFVFLYLWTTGGGPISLDALFFRPKAPAEDRQPVTT